MKRESAPPVIGIISFAHPHAESYIAALRARGVRVIATDSVEHAAPPSDAAPRGRDLAVRLGVEYVDSLDRLLHSNLDGVIVASENSRHRSHTEAALLAGIPVLCEKPLATSVEDAVAMLDLSSRTGVPLMTAYPVRFAPVFGELVQRVHAGEIGQIVSIHGTNTGKLPEGRTWFTDPAQAGGGALIDHVVHCADLIDVLLGETASEVYAQSNRILHARRSQAETGGIVSVMYPSGVIASIDCSWSQPDTAPNWGGLTLEVHGTRGSIRIDPFFEHLGGFDSAGALWEPLSVDLDDLLIGAFLRTVAESATVRNAPDGAVGLRTLAIAAAALRSASTGVPETIRRMPEAGVATVEG